MFPLDCGFWDPEGNLQINPQGLVLDDGSIISIVSLEGRGKKKEEN